MRLTFTDEAWDDYLYWFNTNPKVARKIHALLKDALRHPGEGLGKPELLSQNLSGHWSRRIDHENRLVYRVLEDELLVVSARFHY
ncbi:MAG: Txe/YoeB family addiction module toxin [Dehalococcoidia bacterium]